MSISPIQHFCCYCITIMCRMQEEARNTITQMLDELQFGRTEPIVRVNSVDSGLAKDDINAVMQAKSLPPTWMIPKVNDPMDIQWVSLLHLLCIKRKILSYIPNYCGTCPCSEHF